MEFPVLKQHLIPSSESNIRESYKFENTTLGEGSYGFVRMARKLSTNKQFAVKIIPKKRIKRPDVLTREVSMMKQVDHPHIVRLYESYEDSRYVYLVLELCEGGELFDKLIELGHFTEQQAALLFSQMMSAVAYLHSRHIAHRDLKPENFLFRMSHDFDSLKLIDFGLAKTVSDTTRLTTKTGTCYYVSPETLKGNYDERCDIWSLGVILFMMLAGYPPFDGNTDREIIDNVKKAHFSFDENIWENISEEAKHLICRMLEADPARRISADEALSHAWLLGNQSEPMSPVRIDLNQLERFQSSNKLRKTVLNFMALQCTTTEVSDLIRTFKKIDSNQNGTLSISEIKKVLTVSDAIPREKLDEIINAIDADNSGTIQLSEFIAAMLDDRLYLNEERLWEAFKRFDIDDSGFISPEEIRQVVEGDTVVSGPEVWRELIEAVDVDGDGQISYSEFVKMMEWVSNEEVRVIRRSIDEN